MEFLIKIFKEKFAQMIFDHKRDAFSKNMKDQQKTLATLVPEFTETAVALNGGTEDELFAAVQAYVNLMKEIDAILNFSLDMLAHLKEENTWYNGQDERRRQQIKSDYFMWHELALEYISSEIEFAGQMMQPAMKYFEALSDYPEQQQKLEQLLLNIQKQVETIHAKASGLVRI